MTKSVASRMRNALCRLAQQTLEGFALIFTVIVFCFVRLIKYAVFRLLTSSLTFCKMTSSHIIMWPSHSGLLQSSRMENWKLDDHTPWSSSVRYRPLLGGFGTNIKEKLWLFPCYIKHFFITFSFKGCGFCPVPMQNKQMKL
jgi:hypothetical protein